MLTIETIDTLAAYEYTQSEGRLYKTANRDDYAGHILGYLSEDGRYMTTWHGKTIGRARITARWTLYNSAYSTYMYQIDATIAGVRYTGRCMGPTMSWVGKPRKNQKG